MILSDFLKEHTLIENLYDTRIDYVYLKARFLTRYAKRQMREDMTTEDIKAAAQNVIDINKDFLKNLFAMELDPFVGNRETTTANEKGTNEKKTDFENNSTENIKDNSTTTGTGTLTTTDTGTIKNDGESGADNTNTGYVNAFNNAEPSAANKTTDKNTATASNTETRNTTNKQTRDLTDGTNRTVENKKNSTENGTEHTDNTVTSNTERLQYTFDDYEKTIKRRINAYDFLVNLLSDEILEIVYRL